MTVFSSSSSEPGAARDLIGNELAEVQRELLAAFDYPSFGLFLRDHFNFKLRNIFAPDFGVMVEVVLDTFQSDGRLRHLIAQAAAVKPLRPGLQAVYAKFAEPFIDAGWKKKVAAAQLQTLWTFGLLPEVRWQVAGEGANDDLLSLVSRGGRLEKLISREVPDLDPLVWAARLLKMVSRVCRIEVRNQARGSGFLVGPDLVLTNHHVLADVIDARADGAAIGCWFDHHRQPNGSVSKGSSIRAAAVWDGWHVDSSSALAAKIEHDRSAEPSIDQLDHALVRLERPFGDEPVQPGGPRRGWIHLPASAESLPAGMPLSILQHPGGRPIQLTFDTKAIQSVNPNGTRVRYATNTDGGSSGAPCFDLKWTLVALHHFGGPLDGSPPYNQGVPVSAIHRRLQQQGKAALLGEELPE